MSIGEASSESSSRTMSKRSGKRPGRKASRVDADAKLERSRQSARECRARKKLRYQYLEELVLHREKAVFALRDELETYKQWCIQLDTEERVPDSLLKMIASEEVSKGKKQMEEANRSILQQQRQEELSQFSVSSSSPDSSPSPQHEHSQHQYSKSEHSQHEQSTSEHSQHQSHRQIEVEPSFIPQSSLHHTPSSSQITHPRNLSPHRPPQHQQRQLGQRTEQKTSLHRQMAFDESHSYEIQPIRPSQPAMTVPKTIPPMHLHSQSFDSTTSIFPQQQRVQQLLHQHHIQHLGAGSSSSAPQHYNIPQHVSHASLHSFRTSVKSETPLKYEHAVDRLHSLTSVGLGCSQGQTAEASLPASVETGRARSFSNPTSMVHFPRASSHDISTRSLPGSSRSMTTSHITPGPSSQGSSPGFGLFSGSLIGPNVSPLFLNIPASADLEESSSSDENVSEQQLFHSSLLLQKRKSADPVVPETHQWSRSLRSIASSAGSADSTNDPQMALSNLTTIRCFSTTRTSNTPSPSSVGLVPSGLPSPISVSRHSGASGSTPSSSVTTSPAPLSSISSLLELSASSPGISISTFGTHLDTAHLDTAHLDTAHLHIPEHSVSSSIADSLHCSATSLIASIDEPIPELYSFLADLEEGGMSSFTSRHGASSSHSTPLALTPKRQDQPSTPDPTYLNVPKIIDEYLDSDTEDL